MRSSWSRRSLFLLPIAALVSVVAASAPVRAARKTYFDVTGHWTGTFQAINGTGGDLIADMQGSSTRKTFTATGSISLLQTLTVSGKGTITPANHLKVTLKRPGLSAVLQGTVDTGAAVIEGTFTGKDNHGQKLKGTFTLTRQTVG